MDTLSVARAVTSRGGISDIIHVNTPILLGVLPKISFIIAWKVAGEFVSPKNMTLVHADYAYRVTDSTAVGLRVWLSSLRVYCTNV